MRSRTPALLLALLLAAPIARGEVIERVLAAADGTPVLLSEVKLLSSLRQLTREKAVEALLDEALMQREASRFPQLQPTAEQVEAATTELRSRASGEPDSLLQRLARRQLLILAYVEFRFRPLVRVEQDAVRAAWEAEPEPRDPFEVRRAALRERLERQALDERIESWIADLRRSAEIRYNP